MTDVNNISTEALRETIRTHASKFPFAVGMSPATLKDWAGDFLNDKPREELLMLHEYLIEHKLLNA